MILRRAGASLGCRCSTLDWGAVGDGGTVVKRAVLAGQALWAPACHCLAGM